MLETGIVSKNEPAKVYLRAPDQPLIFPNQCACCGGVAVESLLTYEEHDTSSFGLRTW